MGDDGTLGVCAKCILIFTNVFFMLFGITFLGTGVVLKFLPRFVPIDELVDTIASTTSQTAIGGSDVNLGPLINNTAIALICVGAVIFVISILGICGACCSSPWMLIAYGMIVLLLLIVQVVAVALLATGTANDEIKRRLNETIQEDFRGIDRLNVPSLLLNTVMLLLDCCGIEDYNDFDGATNWVKYRTFLRNGQNVTVTLAIPVACCKTQGSFPDIQPLDDTCFTLPDANNSNFEQGCFDRFQEVVINPHKTPIIVGVSLFLVFEFILGIVAITIAVRWSAKKRDRW